MYIQGGRGDEKGYIYVDIFIYFKAKRDNSSLILLIMRETKLHFRHPNTLTIPTNFPNLPYLL